MRKLQFGPVPRLDSKANSLTEEQVDEISLTIANEPTRKMSYEIKSLEITHLKALSFLSENINNVSPCADIESDNNNMMLVQSSSERSESDREHVTLEGMFNGTLTDLYDTRYLNT